MAHGNDSVSYESQCGPYPNPALKIAPARVAISLKVQYPEKIKEDVFPFPLDKGENVTIIQLFFDFFVVDLIECT
jgi:hypothetical protein